MRSILLNSNNPSNPNNSNYPTIPNNPTLSRLPLPQAFTMRSILLNPFGFYKSPYGRYVNELLSIFLVIGTAVTTPTTIIPQLLLLLLLFLLPLLPLLLPLLPLLSPLLVMLLVVDNFWTLDANKHMIYG